MPSHVKTTDTLGGSVLIGVAAGDSNGLRCDRKRMDVLEGDVTSEETSRIVAPSSSLGSCTIAENSKAPAETL